MPGILSLVLVLVLGACKSEGGSDDVNSPTPRSLGTLHFKKIASDSKDFSTLALEGVSYGTIYKGYYQTLDEIKTEVYISIRDTAPISRLGLEIQGGTGLETRYALNGDRGKHKVWVSVGYRGSSEEDIVKEKECMPGKDFISCLKAHPIFPKIDPKSNASDVADTLEILKQGSFEVDGKNQTAETFFPEGLKQDAYDLYTSSFGGVIFGYLLEEPNAPPLHNVFLSQVTGPSEFVISDGPKAAARRFENLFMACERDTTCSSTFNDLRTNFKAFMKRYKDSPFILNGEANTYASSVFDNITNFISEDEEVGKAIRYMGQIANGYASDSKRITTAIKPSSITSPGSRSVTNVPSDQYPLPPFTDPRWTALLQSYEIDFFPGITNRVAMICSFGFHRKTNPDSRHKLDQVLAQDEYSIYPYGFLMSYRDFTDFCPKLLGIFPRLSVPTITGVDANKVIVFFGGLDIKHTLADAREMVSYFKAGKATLVYQKYLSQGVGQNSDCPRDLEQAFWEDPDTTIECEKQNDYTASQLDGWSVSK